MKETSFEQKEDCKLAFQELKSQSTMAPVLIYFDLQYKIIVKIDTLDYIATGINYTLI